MTMIWHKPKASLRKLLFRPGEFIAPMRANGGGPSPDPTYYGALFNAPDDTLIQDYVSDTGDTHTPVLGGGKISGGGMAIGDAADNNVAIDNLGLPQEYTITFLLSVGTSTAKRRPGFLVRRGAAPGYAGSFLAAVDVRNNLIIFENTGQGTVDTFRASEPWSGDLNANYEIHVTADDITIKKLDTGDKVTYTSTQYNQNTDASYAQELGQLSGTGMHRFMAVEIK